MSAAGPPLKRVRYFTGQLLSANDLTAEQDYLLGRQRRHNRWLHGTGVVSGLRVEAAGGGIVLSPGIALDARGNELVVETPIQCPLPTGTVAFLALRYVERVTDPVPSPDGGGTEASRIEEGVELVWVGTATGEPGVVVARLRRTKRGWRLDPKFRPRRARRRP